MILLSPGHRRNPLCFVSQFYGRKTCKETEYVRMEREGVKAVTGCCKNAKNWLSVLLPLSLFFGTQVSVNIIIEPNTLSFLSITSLIFKFIIHTQPEWSAIGSDEKFLNRRLPQMEWCKEVESRNVQVAIWNIRRWLNLLSGLNHSLHWKCTLFIIFK